MLERDGHSHPDGAEPMEFVRWFDKIRLDDAPLVGGKGANLGELTVAGLPVPPGFVVTSEAYRYAIGHADIAEKLAAVLAGVDTATTADLTRAAHEAQALVVDTRVLPSSRSQRPRRGALLGYRRRRRRLVLRRYERDLHQRQG
jgi:hypothetical protein